MKTRLVITDLTRMYHGNVCVAGYTSQRQCIRPVATKGGIPEESLYQEKRAILYPFALIEIDLLDPMGNQPHTEDHVYNPHSLYFIRHVEDREKILNWSLFDSVEAIFEQEIHTEPGFYVLDCRGPRSLGTLLPGNVEGVIYEPGNQGTWDYRLSFTDQAGKTYRLKIVDLTWQYHCDKLRDEQTSHQAIANHITKDLENRKVYLRIGLARGWDLYPNRCYLQITGIYTFPDYLEGKNFSHFSRKETRTPT